MAAMAGNRHEDGASADDSRGGAYADLIGHSIKRAAAGKPPLIASHCDEDTDRFPCHLDPTPVQGVSVAELDELVAAAERGAPFRGATYLCDPWPTPPGWGWRDAAAGVFALLAAIGVAGVAFGLVISGEVWAILAGLAVAAAGGALAVREWGERR